MIEALLIIHLMIAAAMVGVVLLQKSEGGALGMGGGGGGGGFLTGRGTADLLTRTTAGLAIAFFATSLLLSVLPNLLKAPQASRFNTPATMTDAPQSGETNDGSGKATGGGVLDALKSGQGNQRVPSIPQTQ
ncbi:MAG: preprotein translocase subunit SecG [Pseudomonadota bacterium]